MKRAPLVTPLVLALASLSACGTRGGAGANARDGARDGTGAGWTGATWDYRVDPGKDGVLSVTARFAGPAADLAFVAGASPYARDVTVNGAPVEPNEGGIYPAPACASGCDVAYRFDLRNAARDLGEDDTARGLGASYEAPASTFLLHPTRVFPGETFAFRVTPRDGMAYASSIPFDAAKHAYAGAAAELPYASYSIFGDVETTTVPFPGGSIRFAIVSPSGLTPDRRAALRQWAAASGEVVARYFGRFPIDGALVVAIPGRHHHDDGIGYGRTMAGAGGGAILVDVGPDVSRENLDGDWVLPHEMIHLAVPSLPREGRWLEEGLATYIEPIARARAGRLDERDAWGGLAWGLPRGLPEAGDEGLDRTPTWGRVYWGGALFCFVADVELRKATKNTKGLREAMSAVLYGGGDDRARWGTREALAKGDAALGVDVLARLYDEWSDKPVAVDLDALFASLGIVKTADEDHVTLDDKAPLAAIRKAIVGP